MDECNLAKAMSNAGNQLRYDEYLRILRKESVISKMDKLYCFKYNGENCKITKIEIPEYRIDTNRFTSRKNLLFR